ncbi:related to NmrA-like family protein [Rhynchosporium agropyri]|uniref:Related to NmrA-like family protein n=2 Tax=Rhynchosporium TaxID=38037 RepID=A0A1E1MJG3_RHYSE|nr:related to NmrA-like family protein [Rhynchosporium agropyri]CZT49219.1 related to NmrA-like family protein [Rhynchosporium secalis]
MATVIVFGPTGNNGSVAAQTAHQHGAKVWLAMRDPEKAIPGLTPEAEKAGNYSRVQADLSKPDTVAAAVKTSGATRAFIYVAQGTKDHMKATAEALKASGIEFVVLLSSYTVGDTPPAEVQPSEIIPYAHARLEVTLDEVFGPDGYVAVRPGAFATNLLRQKAGIIAGDVKMYGAGFKIDCITPTDMGAVIGTILAKGPQDGQRKVFLYGPQILSQKQALEIIGDVLGKEIKVSSVDADAALADYLSKGAPKPMAEFFIRALGDTDPALEDASWLVNFKEGQDNIVKYTGRPATTFREWVEANKKLFT